MSSETPAARPGLRVGAVPGVTVTKWTRIWSERFTTTPLEVVAIPQSEQRTRLIEADLDLCFVRQPIGREDLHLIPLYDEAAVVVVPKDHPATVLDEVRLGDLAEENQLDLGDSADEQDQAFDLVAGGAGVLIVPQAIARSHSRRDLRTVALLDAEPTSVGLAWRVDHPSPLIEEFIGVVRGRTLNSSRSPARTESRREVKAPARPGASAGGARGRSRTATGGRRPRRRS